MRDNSYRPLQQIAITMLRLGGWYAVGGKPEVPKAVILAAPHTSNWDGFWGLVYKVAVGLDVQFFAKASLFWFPFGTILRRLGGIPLDRKNAEDAVREAVSLFTTSEQFYFALAPEGTRRLTNGWKSGFYRIAAEAGVPVIPGFLDYRRRRIGLGETLQLSGDEYSDMQKLAAFYSDVDGRHPGNASPVTLQAKKAIPTDRDGPSQ